jgi:iron complex outermembrane receptor protein
MALARKCLAFWALWRFGAYSLGGTQLVAERLTPVRSAALLLGVSATALILATPGLAQDIESTVPAVTAPAPPTDEQQRSSDVQSPTVPAPEQRNTPGTQDDREIVVTGTRIRQPEFTSPDPVQRIDPALSRRAGINDTAEMLQSSPIAAGSTQITSALSSNLVTNGGPGSETIDLRGLGPNRTLVLLNGRRAGPAGTRGGVSSFDLNVLPQSIIKQVDILKTGASSIYGSDAVAGVVNLITKTDTNGIEIDGNVSLPQHGGGEEYRIGATWGKSWDRGHVMIAADYYRQKELARGDRSYLGCPEAYIFRQGSKDRADLVDPRTGKYHCEDFPVGQVWAYDVEYIYEYGPGNLFLHNGTYTAPGSGVTLIQYNYGAHLGVPPIVSPPGAIGPFGAPPGWFPTGYDPASQAIQDDFSPFTLEQSIVPKTERYTLYADAAFELTDGIEAYGEFLANRRKTYQNGWRQIWAFGGTSDYAETYWAQGWTGYNWLSPLAATNHYDASQTVDYWRGVGGIRGDFGGLLKGWSYDAYVQYSHNKGLYRNEQFLQDIYDVSSFQSASCVGTVLPRSGKQCIDLPWTDPNFLAGNFTPQQADYMFDWETGKTIYRQLSIEASVTGNLFHLPAGAVGVALGVTSRRDEIEDTPGAISLAGNAWGGGSGGVTAGHEVTDEAFGEIQVPLFKNQPFARDLSLSGAARITNVKAVRRSDGFTDKDSANWTYKVGANWALNDWLRFRGTYGTSFRAPALFEEFKAPETSFPSARTIDPCVNWAFNLSHQNIDQRTADNCAAEGIQPNYAGGSISANVLSSGGIGRLNPETSKARTASVILTPHFRFLPDTKLSLAVDYFDIRVKAEVSQLGAQNIIFGCYDSPNFPTDPLCSLFTRGQGIDPLAINIVRDPYINIANQRNEGIDFTGLIQHNLGRHGTMSILGNATYQLKDKILLLAGSPEVSNNGDVGDPKIVGDLNVTWATRNGWSFYWGTEVYGKSSNNAKFAERHGGSLCHQADPADPSTDIWGSYCVKLTVPTMFYHSASITKELGSAANRMELTVGVRNMFDTKPPRVSTIGGGGIPTLIGPVVAASQYDFVGRRFFVNLSRKF